MVKLTKELHSSKAQSPMYFTESGKGRKFAATGKGASLNLGHRVWNGQIHQCVMQFPKAEFPMWVTEFGMVKLAKELQP